MKIISLQNFLFLSLFVFLLTSIPSEANAQYSSRIPSSYRSKVSALDDDIVESLPVPILFGVTLRNITPNFGDPRDGGTRTHQGEDIMAPKGAPIVSPTEAVVIRTGDGDSSGLYVTTANPGGERFVYMHLSEILVRGGEVLDEGEIIGLVGNTGNASGGLPHLHFEIRDGRDALDPFPRITREFTLKEKIEFLEESLDAADDRENYIEFIVKTYSKELRQAKALGIELSLEIEKELAKIPVAPVSSATAPGDLARNSTGPLVVTLQQFLIDENTGPAARSLATAGATGFFGLITEKALIEYQAAHGITPAAGYYGPKTRAYILANAN